jgi:hypothetical protein
MNSDWPKDVEERTRETQNDGPGPSELDHDDAIVFDNKPVHFDFTRPPKPRGQNSGRTWTRNHSGFFRLLVTQTKGATVTAVSKDPLPTSTLKFALRSESDKSKKVDVSFASSTTTRQITVTVEPQTAKFKRKEKKAQVLIGDGIDDLRLVSINGRDSRGDFTISFVEGDEFLFDKVEGLIRAVEDPDS